LIRLREIGALVLDIGEDRGGIEDAGRSDLDLCRFENVVDRRGKSALRGGAVENTAGPVPYGA
jgi:hypothetical protein